MQRCRVCTPEQSILRSIALTPSFRVACYRMKSQRTRCHCTFTDTSVHYAIRMDSSRTCVAVLRVHNKHLVARQCAIRCSDRDRPGGGPCWNSGFDKAGTDKVERCGCAVEENLAGVGEALPQDLHHSARSTINGQVGHERRQARIEAIEDTLAPVSAAERIS